MCLKIQRMSNENIFLAQGRVVGTASKRIFDSIAPSGTVHLECHSPNVIYLTFFSRCSLQYAGKDRPEDKRDIHLA